MHLDYEYTPDDYRELMKVGRQNLPKRSHKFGRGMLGWFLFIGLALILIWLVNHNHAQAQTTPAAIPASDGAWQYMGLAVLSWLILGFFFVFIFIYVRFPSDAAIKKRLGNQKLISMDINEIGVRTSAGATETLWKWDAFDEFVETDQRFFLRLTKTINFVLVPKRAVIDKGEVDLLRELLRSHIQPPTGAFPVIPI